MTKIAVEILAPAGEIEHVQCGINNHVHALYGGLKTWNARNKAKNFTIREYNKVIKLCKQNNIKFYLTLNTLLRGNEIQKITNMLKNKTLFSPNALIVTDIGLINVLNKQFPEIEKHASTQFGSHCIDDVNYLLSENIKRVIISRELTIQEIKTIKQKSNLEIEVFIWGSQCISFSGMCFWGSLLCSGSANRGKCNILCRDLYSCGKNKGHLMYIPDLDTISCLEQLKFVDCVKLEGRRRSVQEIDQTIKRIRANDCTVNSNGYLFGTSINQNKLFEKVNSRIKTGTKVSEILHPTSDDIFVKIKNGKYHNITHYSKNLLNKNYYYVYSEKNKPFTIGKKNISVEINNTNDGKIKNILYVGNNGNSKIFNIKVSKERHTIEHIWNILKNINADTNLYKLKYQKSIINNYYISEKQLEIIKRLIV